MHRENLSREFLAGEGERGDDRTGILPLLLTQNTVSKFMEDWKSNGDGEEVRVGREEGLREIFLVDEVVNFEPTRLNRLVARSESQNA